MNVFSRIRTLVEFSIIAYLRYRGGQFTDRNEHTVALFLSSDTTETKMPVLNPDA